jgi:diacylglycerol kinase
MATSKKSPKKKVTTRRVRRQVLDTKKEFSLLRRAKSFTYAGRGLYIFVRSTHNAWIHLVILAIAIALGLYLHITVVEWMLLVLVGGFVLAAEAFNTAIEIDIDLTSPTYHPYARDTKDVAAGAVLIAAHTALIVGVFIFGHYLV